MDFHETPSCGIVRCTMAAPVSVSHTHVHSIRVGHVVSLVPRFDLVYTNSPLVVRLFRERGVEVQELPLFKREAYSGTHIRKLIYEDGDWMSLLPKEAAGFILEIDGPQRIRETFRYSTPYGTREEEGG